MRKSMRADAKIVTIGIASRLVVSKNELAGAY
jgi:hypothetical protein